MTISNEEREKLIAACVAARANHDPVEAQKLFDELPHWDDTVTMMAVMMPGKNQKKAEKTDN